MLRADARGVLRARLHEQGRRLRPERRQSVRHAGLRLDRRERGAVHQFDGGDRRGLHRRHRHARRAQVVEQHQRRRLVRVVGHRAVRDGRQEAERAFGADQQVREDLHRVVEVDQRVEPVAGRVLHPVLVPDARGERGVARVRCARRSRRCSSGRVRLAERSDARGVVGVEHARRRRAPRARRRACDSCSRACRSTCRSRCWRRCRRSSRRRSTRDRDRSCGRAARARGSRARRSPPGPRRIVAPPSRTSICRKPSPSSTSTESEIAWPERLVPAARKVSGAPSDRHTSSTARTSCSVSTMATARGTSR